MKAVMVSPTSPTASFNGANVPYSIADVGQQRSLSHFPESGGILGGGGRSHKPCAPVPRNLPMIAVGVDVAFVVALYCGR